MTCGFAPWYGASGKAAARAGYMASSLQLAPPSVRTANTTGVGAQPSAVQRSTAPSSAAVASQRAAS